MLASSALSVFLGATVALASVARVFEPSTLSVDSRRCGTFISEEDIIAAEKHFEANKVSLMDRPQAKRAPGSAAIDVYFHVISADSTPEGGVLSDDVIDAQMSVLNDGFAKSGLTFALANVTRTLNDDWFSNAGPNTTQQDDMKQALRVGRADALNLYSVGFKNTDHLGYATFPVNYTDNPWDDGVVFLYSSVPGGAMVNYNEGKTLTHEVGHWVGLYHTFQGGCSEPNDYVSDTPEEANPTSGCPSDAGPSPDTCPSTGVDPIHNFMDYSYDSCLDEFTTGQNSRLKDQLATYRHIQI